MADTFWISEFQNWKIINEYCFKLLSLRQSIVALIGKEYKYY
jgi:hypothetical protein